MVRISKIPACLLHLDRDQLGQLDWLKLRQLALEKGSLPRILAEVGFQHGFVTYHRNNYFAISI